MSVRWLIAAALSIACASEPLADDAAPTGAAGASGVADGGAEAGEAGDGPSAAGCAAGEAGAAVAGAGGARAEAGAGGTPSSCPATGEAIVVGTLGSAALDEASGLAASRRLSGLLYSHNDSGSSSLGYALRQDGSLVATLELVGALTQDWEDVAVGPGPESAVSYIYFADIGDNDVARNGIVVHRSPEPDLDVDVSDQNVELEFDSLYFEYPDDAHDAETLFVDPDSADLYIVTKSLDASDVYVARAPHSTTEITTLEHVGELTLPRVSLATGGDMAADGSLIVIRTYDAVFGWPRSAGESVQDVLAREPCELTSALEPQAEAIAIAPDASGYFTVGEGSGASLFRVDFE